MKKKVSLILVILISVIVTVTSVTFAYLHSAESYNTAENRVFSISEVSEFTPNDMVLQKEQIWNFGVTNVKPNGERDPNLAIKFELKLSDEVKRIGIKLDVKLESISGDRATEIYCKYINGIYTWYAGRVFEVKGDKEAVKVVKFRITLKNNKEVVEKEPFDLFTLKISGMAN